MRDDPRTHKLMEGFYILSKDGVEKEKIIFCDRNDSCYCARAFGYLSDLPVIWGVIIIMRGGVMLYEKE